MPPRRANANANTRKLNRQLQTAVVANDERGVRKAVERGAEVNAVMESGYAADNVAPLHHAAAQGNEGMVRVLAELGAALDMQDNYGFTAVFLASQEGHTETVRTLAQLGANINTPQKNDGTPVYVAAQSGHTAVSYTHLTLPTICSV